MAGTNEEKARAMSEKNIEKVDFGPYIPKNFVLERNSAKDFILTLCMSSLTIFFNPECLRDRLVFYFFFSLFAL